jgi:NitT/TauT family transport system substrate-binding protein
MRRRSVLLAAAATLLPIRARAQEAATIRIAEPATEDTTNLFYGVKSGMFERAGLKVDIFHTQSGSAAVAAMISGNYEIAGAGLLSILQAHLRGVEVTVIEPESLVRAARPQSLLQVPKDSTIANPTDLNGKIIGVPALNDVNAIVIRNWHDKNGGRWQSLQFVEIPNSALVAALVSHRIDAAILQQPALSLSLADGSTKTLANAYESLGPTVLAAVYVARTDWVKANRELVRRFHRVYLDATTYVNTHPAETAQYVSDLTRISLVDAQKMQRTVNPTVLNAAEIQPLIDAAAKYGSLPRSFPAQELYAAL